ncbi:MAG: hypothetical protein IPM61_11590 [Chlorobi bacterium]|nr:MAG: glycosyl hydrolase [Chlorobi bacterium OLB7]MBK8911958.1 hypothetical protein [Chlorobiota bacterium]MBX7215404.1 hypothetical protein [Candidatus Kapabacteria bacterium]
MTATENRLYGCAAALLVLLSSTLVAQQRTPVFNPEKEAEKHQKIFEESLKDRNREETGEDVRGRDEWFRYQRAYPYDVIPSEGRIQALQEMEAMQHQLATAMKKQATAGFLGATAWTSIGPFNSGGRIRSVVLNPYNSQTIFIGAAGGGVWKTMDGGANWSTTFDKQPALVMGAIAIDPTDTNTIYAGTGENVPAFPTYEGEGIFKSSDGGNTWEPLGLSSVGAFSKIAVNWQNRNIVYAAAARSNGGFYRSDDAGKTWNKTFNNDLFDMSVNAKNPNTLIVATTNGLYRSTDGGIAFVALGGSKFPNASRVSVAISPSDTNRVYALFSTFGGQGGNNLAEIYVSKDGGNAWTLSKKFDERFFRNQGYYNNCIEVHPTNPEIVIAGGIDLYQTINGGVEWVNLTNNYTAYPPFDVTHPDQHVIAFDPINPDVVHNGNDGGYYRSDDGGNNWQRSALLPITQFYKMDVDQSRPYRAYGGSQDNGTHGTFSGKTEFGQQWRFMSGGDGFWAVVDLNVPDQVFTESQNGETMYLFNTRTNNLRWLNTAPMESDPGNWSTPMAMNPADYTTFYTARTQLWRTTNYGTSWSSNPVPGGLASTMAVSPHDGVSMLVGKGSGGVYYSSDDGQTWKACKGLPNLYVTDLVYDFGVEHRVYATFSGYNRRHVYRSDDDGANFVDITNNLPNIPVNAIEVDPINKDRLFVGTDIGVFVSLDGGGTWYPFSEGLPVTLVFDLKIHRDSRTLVAATFGRSMFQISIENPQVQPLLVAPAGGEVIETPSELTVSWLGFTKNVQILISYDGGRTWETVADDVAGNSTKVQLPLARATNAKVKVIEKESGRTVESLFFTLTAAANTQSLNQRGFVAQALAIRHGYLWASTRGSDTIYRMKLPSILTKIPIVRTGFTGEIRDLAWDPAADQFYVLVSDSDFSNPQVWRMDTTGAAAGSITLPEEAVRISGIEITPEGLALITPGTAAQLFVLDPTTGTVLAQRGPLQGAVGGDRRSLAWDGQGLTQGIPEAAPGTDFPTQIQQLRSVAPFAVTNATPVIINNVTVLQLVGLTFDSANSDAAKRLFYATDTAGAIYRISLPQAIVTGAPIAEENFATSAALSIRQILPNPVRGNAQLRFWVANAGEISVGIWNANGEQVAKVFEGKIEAGERELTVNTQGLAGGLYYVALSNANGDREIQPIVVLR